MFTYMLSKASGLSTTASNLLTALRNDPNVAGIESNTLAKVFQVLYVTTGMRRHYGANSMDQRCRKLKTHFMTLKRSESVEELAGSIK